MPTTKKRKFLKTRLEKVLFILLVLILALEVVFVAQPGGYTALMRVLRRPEARIQEGYVWMLPNKLFPRTGDVLTVQLRTAKAHDLYGLQFDLEYDGSVLQYINMTEGSFLGQDGAATYWYSPEPVSEAGSTTKILQNIIGTRLNTELTPDMIEIDFPQMGQTSVLPAQGRLAKVSNRPAAKSVKGLPAVPEVSIDTSKGISGNGHLITVNFNVIGVGMTALKVVNPEDPENTTNHVLTTTSQARRVQNFLAFPLDLTVR